MRLFLQVMYVFFMFTGNVLLSPVEMHRCMHAGVDVEFCSRARVGVLVETYLPSGHGYSRVLESRLG